MHSKTIEMRVQLSETYLQLRSLLLAPFTIKPRAIAHFKDCYAVIEMITGTHLGVDCAVAWHQHLIYFLEYMLN